MQEILFSLSFAKDKSKQLLQDCFDILIKFSTRKIKQINKKKIASIFYKSKIYIRFNYTKLNNYLSTSIRIP